MAKRKLEMIEKYYAAMSILSVLLTILYVYQWHRRFDVNITAVFILVPIVNLGYFVMGVDPELAAVIYAVKVTYVGGCFLPWFIVMCILNLCRITVKRWIRVVSFMLNLFLYCTVLTIGDMPLFYRDIRWTDTDLGRVFQKTYGPMHTVFVFCVIAYFIFGLLVMGYCYFKKRQVSRRILHLLFMPNVISLAVFIVNHFWRNGPDMVPLTYVLGQTVYLLIVYRVSLYGVSDMVIESMVQSGDTGFIKMDFKYRYLGSNRTARQILPALRDLAVDQKMSGVPELEKNVLHWVRHFEEDESAGKNLFRREGADGNEDAEVFQVQVNYLYDGRRRRGYQIFLSDDTQNQKYIRLIDQYNNELEEEVAAKTERIVQMHDNLILSMATMVESRDNSTGGHIRRTSVGVRILVEELKKEGRRELTEEFCKNIIKAAPMHDLGKIAVDDAILRKPGRFEPEEFEVMKKHAAEGARIVHEILKETDDQAFHLLAENVAHYHHERWDGSGYPDGLKAEEIPLEARIMAVADVYDALVSKRVYKERMSFEEADRIIMEGMGKHFDPALQGAYEKARPRLEAYYSGDGEE
ncbi:MAG: HD domain-containing protein [Lachnospiraceae bacterium]|nr:HD domain-containing protein [Lachnospiraceae bacterium]